MARVLVNFTYVEIDGKPCRRGLPVADIAKKFLELIHPIKLRRVTGELIAIDEDNKREPVKTFRNDTSLFGWLQAQGVAVCWATKSDGCVTRGDFYAALSTLIPKIESVRDTPHVPPLEDVYYVNCDGVGDKYTGRLDELVDFWLPHTEKDRSLIKAAFCTPFWGGRPGGRPAISIESDGVDNGRGVGKSQLLYAIAKIAGGYIDCRLSEDMDQIKKRLLGGDTKINVVAFDNCKSAKVSSGDLEGLITAPSVSGWKPHVGNSIMKNYLTYVFSMNDPSFSADMASRSLRIILSRRPVEGNWEARLDDLIEKYRHEVVNDCIHLLRKPSVEQKRYIRFSSWQREVLSKIDGTAAMADLVIERQQAVDGDAEEMEDLTGIIVECISSYKKPNGAWSSVHLDPEKDSVLIARAVMAHWLRDRLGRKMTDANLTKMLGRAKIPNLATDTVVRDGVRYWYWKPSVAFEYASAWRISKSDERELAREHLFSKGVADVVQIKT